MPSKKKDHPNTNGNWMQFRIAIPDAVARAYTHQAERREVELEDLLAERLCSSVQHAAEKPLYFDDAERRELEMLLGKNISSVKEALTLIRQAVSVRLEDVEIVLKPSLLSRLKHRCLGMEWGAFLKLIVVQNLERYAGMR